MSYRRRGLGNGCPVIDLARNACQLPGDAPGQVTPCTLIRECDSLTGAVHWQYQLPGGAAANVNIWNVDLETDQAQYFGPTGAPVTPWLPVQITGTPPAYSAVTTPVAATAPAPTTPAPVTNYAAAPAAAPPPIPVYATGYWSEAEPVRSASWWESIAGRMEAPLVPGVSNWILAAAAAAAWWWARE